MMHMYIKSWTIEKLFQLFKDGKFTFAEYQRNPRIWNREKKQKLIDSIVRKWDIPKFYFYKTDEGEYEVVDGQQRIESITEFLMDKFRYKPSHDLRTGYAEDEELKKFSKLDNKEGITKFVLTMVIIEGEITEDGLNLLFFRLQLGEALNSGEKLNAMTGNMRDFIFHEELPKVFQIIKAPARRFGKEVLVAQICNNLFSLHQKGEFTRSRFKDLKKFFNEYSEKTLPSEIIDVFNKTAKILADTLRDNAKLIKSKGLAISLFFMVNQIINNTKTGEQLENEISKFYEFLFEHFLVRLKEQLKKGFTPDPQYVPLLEFQKNLTQAAAEKYSIKNRHNLLEEYFNFFKKKGKIKGD